MAVVFDQIIFVLIFYVEDGVNVGSLLRKLVLGSFDHKMVSLEVWFCLTKALM